MDFTGTIEKYSYGRGYSDGFRAGWDAHVELVESRQRWEEKIEPAVDSSGGTDSHGSR